MNKEFFLSFFRAIKSIIVYRPKAFMYLLRHSELYKHQSYFPEKRNLSPGIIFCEQFYHIIKYGAVNKFYFPYGFDVKNKQEKREYVDYYQFMNRRDELNLGGWYNSTCILRNKLVFNIVANGLGVRTAKNYFLVKNNNVFVFDSKESIGIEKIKLFDNSEFFCKLIDGECGTGIFRFGIRNGNLYINDKQSDICDLQMMFSRGTYLAQEIVCQHKLMSALHPASINTMRLITVKNPVDGIVTLLPSILRIGTGDSIVDNTSRGGIAVGIDTETGRLKKYGFYKPEYGLKVDVHPDSNIRFENYEIPYFKEAKEMAIRFHEFLDIHSVGWDIAICPDGPVFIEGNDNWEINGPQICNGGMKKEFKKLFTIK